MPTSNNHLIGPTTKSFHSKSTFPGIVQTRWWAPSKTNIALIPSKALRNTETHLTAALLFIDYANNRSSTKKTSSLVVISGEKFCIHDTRSRFIFFKFCGPRASSSKQLSVNPGRVPSWATLTTNHGWVMPGSWWHSWSRWPLDLDP